MTVRILVADDFPQWRTFALSVLSANSDWKVVGAAADGTEVIQKALELTPDLFVLDIGLPKISGIDVACQIRQRVPGAKILFLSAYDSLDVVEAALDAGAAGYVVKTDAGAELSRAVEAVLRGQHFISSSLRRRMSADGEITLAQDCHGVQFYFDDEILLNRAVHFVRAALEVGNPAIVIATKPHGDSFIQRLKAQGVDVDALIQQGAYISLNAADVLSTFMIDDWPDESRFMEGFGRLISSTSKAVNAQNPRIAIFGEGVALLVGRGQTKAAIRVEQLSNALAEKFNVDILCAYPFSAPLSDDEHVFTAICAEHSVVYSS